MNELQEILKLTKENNIMLKELLTYIAQKENNASIKDFIINYIANKAADIY